MNKYNGPISPQLVIPASFAECMTYEKQILWLKKEIDSVSVGVEPEVIAEIQNQLTLLSNEVSNLNDEIDSYNIQAIEQSINQLEISIQSVINSLDDYATKTDISDMETKTDAAATYATKDEISDMETKTDAAATYATKSELSGYATKDEISDMETKTDASVTYATKDEISDMETKTNAAAKYATKKALNTGLSKKQDKLTFDMSPQPNSRNPVWSEGIYEAIQNAGKGSIMSMNSSFVCQYYGSPDIIDGMVYIERIDEPKNSISPWYSSEITGKIQQSTAIIDLPLSTTITGIDHIIIDFSDYTPYTKYMEYGVQYVITMKNAIAITSTGVVTAHLQYVANPTKHSNFTKPALESIEDSIKPFNRIIIYADVIAYKITTT